MPVRSTGCDESALERFLRPVDGREVAYSRHVWCEQIVNPANCSSGSGSICRTILSHVESHLPPLKLVVCCVGFFFALQFEHDASPFEEAAEAHRDDVVEVEQELESFNPFVLGSCDDDGV